MKACSNCGHIEKSDARFCGVCGTALDATQPVMSEQLQTPVTAEALASGVHPGAEGVPAEDTTAWPQPPQIEASPDAQPTSILPGEATTGVGARRRRRWPWIVAAIVVFLAVGGTTGALFATGVLPPKSGPTRLTDTAFAQALNSKAARGLSQADAQAKADLAKTGGPSANKIDADGATISAYSNEARTELPSSTNLSAAQLGELRLVEKFLASNHRYGVALQQDSSSATTSSAVVRAAAAVAAADRVARTAISGTSGLPAPADFASPSGTGHRHLPGGVAGGLTACDQNISVDSVTSCPFAENVFRAYVRSYRFSGKQADVQVQAFSPVTHRPYSMDCFLTSRQTVDCTGGRKAFVTFPFGAAANY